MSVDPETKPCWIKQVCDTCPDETNSRELVCLFMTIMTAVYELDRSRQTQILIGCIGLLETVPEALQLAREEREKEQANAQ